MTSIRYDLEPEEIKFIDYLNDQEILLGYHNVIRIKALQKENNFVILNIKMFITIQEETTYYLTYQEEEPQPILDDDSVDPLKNFYVPKKVIPLGENWYLLISKQNKNVTTMCTPKLDETR